MIELLVTLAIAAILLAVGVPSFQNVMETNRLATQANNLVTAVNLARSEAIKRGTTIRITPESNDYQLGWCVHTGNACSAATAIRSFQPMEVAVTSNNATTLVFNGRGQKTAPNGNVDIGIQPQGCATGTADRGRTIRVENTGRVSVTVGACA